MSIYHIGILGTPTEGQKAELCSTLREMVAPYGLTLHTDIAVLDPHTSLSRPSKAAFAAAWFGAPEHDPASVAAAKALVRDNLPIIPVVADIQHFRSNVPEFLHFANGMTLATAGPRLERLASALLECVGLLRRQRRIFISYRRDEAATAALHLHEALSAAGFDVFLDSYSVRPAEDFQAVLWHRLCDSDVMVMLDTPNFFGSRWTPKEVGRALAKNIAILGIVWPQHTPQRTTQMREPILLQSGDLLPDGRLSPATIERVRICIEQLRSRSLAIRHAALAGVLRSGAEAIGGRVDGVGAHRALAVMLPQLREHVRVFPAVGVPTAETFQEIAEQGMGQGDANAVPVLLYDHVGLHSSWQDHLAWLQKNLRVVRVLQASQAAWDMADWEA